MSTEHPKTLTREQLAVVDSDERSLVVRASAGTGKTTTLVERFLRHVTRDGMRPDQILTITFTRKAAAEMKRRIVDTLMANGLRDEAQMAETGPISTIHGFCERVLRECSVDAGLDPDFTILDETESGRRLKDAVREAIGALESDPLTEELLSELAGKQKQGGGGPHALLEEGVADVTDKIRGTLATREKLQERYANPEHVLDYWRESVLEALPPAVLEELAKQPAGEHFGVRLRKAIRTAKIPEPRGLPNAKGEGTAYEADRRCARQSCALMRLACLTWKLLEERNAADGALDFNGLERQTIALLDRSPVSLGRIRQQFRAVLIDESQDMNPVQHALVEKLGIEAEMLVGDAQQSIYSFRHADVRLFEERAGRTPTLQLSANKRSRQGVLQFVDELFSNIWEGRYAAMAEPPAPGETLYRGVELWLQSTKDLHQIAEWVEEIAREDGPGNVAVLVRSGGYAQDLLTRLQARGVPARIIGGSERYYTRIEVRDFSNLLSALLNPRQDFPLVAVLHSPLVGLTLDTIVALTQEGGVWAKLSDYEPPIPEDRERIATFLSWFVPLTKIADRLPAWELLSAAIARSPYLENIARRPNGVQTIANVRKLLTIGASMPEADARAFARRMREIQSVRHREGDASVSEDDSNEVSILTIHKAKGLEFDSVIVPDTFLTDRNMGDVELDRRGMLTTKFGRVEASTYHAMNTHWRKERDRQEGHRLLYVALTRAKKRLCLVVDPAGKSRKLATEILEWLGWKEAIPDSIVVRHSAPTSESVPFEGDSAEFGPE